MKDNVFGKILKQLRLEKGLSQRKLGEDLDVVNQTVSFWEIGTNEPDYDMLIKIANYFSVSVGYLLGVEEI